MNLRQIIGCTMFFLSAAGLVSSIVIGIWGGAVISVVLFVISFAMTIEMEDEVTEDE